MKKIVDPLAWQDKLRDSYPPPMQGNFKLGRLHVLVVPLSAGTAHSQAKLDSDKHKN